MQTSSFREEFIHILLSAYSRRNVARQMHQIRERIMWPKEQLENFRLNRMRDILDHAATSVPYWKRVFHECKFNPKSFTSFEQLKDITPLTRQHLRDLLPELQSTTVRPSQVSERSTGGTSGTPVKVILEKRHSIEKFLITHRMYWLMRKSLGMPTLMIAGNPIDYNAWNSFNEKLKNFLFNVTVRSSFQLTPTALDSFLAALNNRQFRFVLAYATVFDLLCSRLESRGETVSVPAIIPCAELVSMAQRERWKNILGAEVFEIYGSREMVAIAGETTDHDALLVNSDIYHVEIVDEKGASLPYGEPGLITITSLLESAMPLLRYQLGDIGTLYPPSGQFAAPRIRVTHGRVLDVIRCPNGKMLPGEFFPHLIKEVTEVVEQYQIVQTTSVDLIVKLVIKKGYSDKTTNYLARKIQEQVGHEVKLAFEFPKHIDTAASGKFRPTVSLVANR